MDNGSTPLILKFSNRQLLALVALVVLMASFFVGPGALAQTDPAPPGQVSQGNTNGSQLSPGASQTQDTVPDPYYNANGYTNLVQQQAEQNTPAVAQNVEQQLWPDFGAYNETYDGLSAFWGDDIISNFFSNIGQLIGKWLAEFINGWVADTVQFLTGFLRVFVLNPNIAVNGLGNNGPADDISPYIRQGADIMYGIAVDLLLLLFVLCIWRFWAEAAWRGGGNLMGAVGRLIFTAGLMLAWPTIYAFEIQISNEMIKAIYFNSADQVAMLDAAMAAAVKGGLVAGAGLLANATAPIAGQVFGGALGAAGGAGGPIGMTLGMVGGLIAFVGLIIYLVLGGILIAELIYIMVLKSIQTALLCAQYMFAPLFLVFMATPDTEQVCSGFVRSFVEVSLWTFVWVGLLKIMVIVVLSNFNPWGKIVMTVGVLQLMIQVPSFLSRAQISPMSDFISAGLVTGGLLKGGAALSRVLSDRSQQFANAVGNFGYAGAKGAPKSQTTELNGLANDVARPELLKDIRGASATGAVPGEKGPKDGKGKGKDGDNPGGQPLNPIDPNAPKGPKGAKDKEDEKNKTGEPPSKTINPATGLPDGPKGDKSAMGTPEGKLNPSATPGAEGAKLNNPGSPEAKGGDKSGVGDALAQGAKNGALGLGAGIAAGAGLAAMEGGAALRSNNGQPQSTEEQKNATAAQQQAAEALKKLEGLNNAGAGDGTKLDKDGKPINAAGDGKTQKVQGGTISPPPGPDGGKGKGDAANAAGALADTNVTGTIKGQTGAKGTGSGSGGDANAKGKELTPNLGAGDVKAGMTPPGEKPDGAKGGAGNNVEMEFDRGDDKAVAAAQVAGLGGGPGKLTDLKDQSGGDKTGGTGGPTGGKQVIAGGKLDGAGGSLNNATGASADVTGKLLPKKPGESVSGKVVPPSATGANLQQAVSSAGTGKNIDPMTGNGVSDVVHDDKDPGAPITTPNAKTEVHSSNSANQLVGAGATGGKGEVTGKIVSGGNVPPGGTAAGNQQNLNLPTGGKNVNPTDTSKGAQVGQTITSTGTVPAGGKGLDNSANVTTNEIVQEDRGDGVSGPGTGHSTTQIVTNPGGNQAGANAKVDTSATGKIISTGAAGLTPPPNPNLTGNQAGNLTATGKAANLSADGKTNLQTGAQNITTAGGGQGGRLDQSGVVNNEIVQQDGADSSGQPGSVVTNQTHLTTNATGGGASGAGAKMDGAGKVVTGQPGLTPPPSQQLAANNQPLTLPIPGKGNLGADNKGVNMQAGAQTITQGSNVSGRVVDGTGVVNNEIVQQDGVTEGGAPGAHLGTTTTHLQSNTGAGTNAGAQMRTDAQGKVVTGGNVVQPPPTGVNVQPNLNTPGVTGKLDQPGSHQPVVGSSQVVSAGGNSGRPVDTPAGIVNTEITEDGALGGQHTPGVTTTHAEMKSNVVPPSGQNVQGASQTVTGKVVTGVGGNQTPPPIQNVQSQFTQATGGHGAAPIAAAAGGLPPPPAGGGAGGGGGSPPGGGGPPPFNDASEEHGPGSNPGPPNVEAGMGTQAASNRTQGSMYDGYMQSGYRHVPYRVAAAAIRLAQGATLAPSRSGKPEVIQDNQGHVMHYRFGEGATDEQKAMQIMTGAYGELMSSDAEAYDAARMSAIDAGEHKPKGMAQNIAAGILAYNGSSWTQTAAAKQNFQRSMAKHATLGAQAYVAGESGNAYTEYLTNRYGPMSDEQQAWGVHMMTDASSPESGWSWRMGPATDALIQNGLPISPVHRAVAANPSVLKAQPWLRGAAIRGGVQYMQSRAEQTMPEGTNGLVQDAWYGNQAQAMAPEVVNTVGAITLALGEKACSDTATIDKVAAMIGPQGRPEDAVGAYNALKGGNHVMARMQQRYSGPTGGGGGGGGGFNMGSTTVNGGPMGGGPSDIGNVQTSVSGNIVGGNVGSSPRNNAEIDMVFGGGNSGGGNINPNNIPLPNLAPPQNIHGGTTQANFRVVGGGNQSNSGGGNQNFTMRMPGQNVGSTSEQIVTGHISGDSRSGGGGNAPDRVVGVDVVQDVNQHVGGASYSPSSGDVQSAFAGALQQHGGSDNMVQRTIADLRSTGMQWNQIFDPAKSDSDPGKYQLLETAMECQARDIPVTTVAIAARAMGSGNVTPQHVEIVQNMLDADPRWSPQSISYSDVYTAQALVEAHRVDPGLYGNPYLSKDYVDAVKADPRFTPRPVPMRNPLGQIVDYAKSRVPEDLLMRRTQQGYGGGQQGGRSRFGGGGGGGGYGGGGGGHQGGGGYGSGGFGGGGFGDDGSMA